MTREQSARAPATERRVSADRITLFCRAVCNAYCDGENRCVMDEPGKPECTSKNCHVYPLAVELLAKLDVRVGYHNAIGDCERLRARRPYEGATVFHEKPTTPPGPDHRWHFVAAENVWLCWDCGMERPALDTPSVPA